MATRARIVLWVLAGVLGSVPLSTPGSADDCRAPFPLLHKNTILQTQLRLGLRRAGLDRALARRQLAVSLVDLSIPGDPVYAGVNDDHMMYAASLPKIGILLALLEEVNAGRVEWTDEFPWRLERMITISDNVYATWAAKLVGLRGIARVLREPRYCLYEEGVGGLWVGRAFEKGGESYRDPLKGISHGATARQTARFYVLLDERKLVSPYWSEWMLSRMGPPAYVHKFYRALRERERIEFVARKSGTWERYHSDSALIQHAGRRYVLVGLVDHEEGEEMLQQIAEAADDVIARGEHRSWPEGGAR